MRIFNTKDGFGFECDCGFKSTKWRKREHVELRFQQHLNEHQTGEPMCSLQEFYLLIGEEY